MAPGMRAPRTRDKRKTLMYYIITAVFAMLLIAAAIAVFSPSEEVRENKVNADPAESKSKDSSLPVVGDEADNKENGEGDDKDLTEKEAQEGKEIEHEIDATDLKKNDDTDPKKKADDKTDEVTRSADDEQEDAEEKSDEATKSADDQELIDAEEKDEESSEEKKPQDEQKKDVTETAELSDELAVNKTELELTVENKEVPNAWASQVNESKAEIKQEAQEQPSEQSPPEAEEQQKATADEEIKNWELCRFTNAADYIPCLDNQKAIKKLKSTHRFEHRERHCPIGEDLKKCLVPLPQGYQAHVNWPQSRKQVWYSNVPHPGLVSYKKDQNWVKKKDDLLIFPGGGTQFKQGAERYIEFIEIIVPEIAWGKHVRTVLDVGCGVASFGGFLFDKNVLTMSFAPKDEHEAQVQLALERGIPAVLAVMGTQRLVYPSNAYDIAHCARCRVHWHGDGGRLLLELNRLIRPGGYFVWSAFPVYKTEQEEVDLWRATKAVTDSMCWKLIKREKDPHTGVGVAIFQKPLSNTCYENRQKNVPPLCDKSDNPDAAWYVPMQSCLHKLPADGARGSLWPQEWPQRLNATPSWLGAIPQGLFGKAAVEEFGADTEHWHHVVEKSYARGLEIDWTVIRNVMDMKAGYGGFAAALVGRPVWVLNVVPVTEPDTLPIIFERGLIGQYHDWCESFSTYPRSYDLLHADHLFHRLKQSCGVVNTVLEMDRILRPGGWGIFRDTVGVLGEIEPLLKSLHWEIRVSYTEDQERLIAAQKTLWRP